MLAGYSAALLLGAGCAPSDAPAEVLVPSDARGHPGLRVRRDRLAESEIATVDGCRVTSAARTAWDLARRLPLVEAVVAVDSLARVGRFPPADLLTRRLTEPRARGCRKLDEVVDLCDCRAESPMETRLRLALVRHGLPRPEAQYRVLDEHGFPLARVDLAYPPAQVAIEYDGVRHLDRQRWSRDRARDTTLAGAGWQTLRFGPDDIGMFQTVRRGSTGTRVPETQPARGTSRPSTSATWAAETAPSRRMRGSLAVRSTMVDAIPSVALPPSR